MLLNLPCSSVTVAGPIRVITGAIVSTGGGGSPALPEPPQALTETSDIADNHHKMKCRTVVVSLLVYIIVMSLGKQPANTASASIGTYRKQPKTHSLCFKLETELLRFSQMYCFGWVSTYTTEIKVNREPVVRW